VRCWSPSLSRPPGTPLHAHRWALAALLLVHLLVIGFWLGALLPLILVTLRAPERTAHIVRGFSRSATALVPLILAAGLVMAYLLIPRVEVLREPYGLLLLAKVAGFAVLLALAAINKWLLGPDFESGHAGAARRRRRSVSVEYALIVAVLGVTAVMTSFFSPEA
jgi:copper resistance protein D